MRSLGRVLRGLGADQTSASHAACKRPAACRGGADSSDEACLRAVAMNDIERSFCPDVPNHLEDSGQIGRMQSVPYGQTADAHVRHRAQILDAVSKPGVHAICRTQKMHLIVSCRQFGRKIDDVPSCTASARFNNMENSSPVHETLA
jgi:hypothetical protein